MRGTGNGGAWGTARAAWRVGLAALLVGAAGAVLALGGAALAEEQGKVSGRLVGGTDPGALEGTTVVLLWFRADAEGKPTGGPLGRQATGKDGGYVFVNVPIDPKARYQLGARVAGNLVSSEPFFFGDGKTEQSIDLRIPALSSDASVLAIGQALYAFEPRLGRFDVTEVIHMENPTQAVIDVRREPLDFPVPAGAEDLQMVRFDLEQGSHERLGARLLVSGELRPGTNSIAFRYRLPAALGSARLTKSYPLPIREVVVLTPHGSLAVQGTGLTAQAPRTIEQQVYSAWGAADVQPGSVFTLRVSGGTINQALYLLPTVGFLLLMGGVVFWFMRARLAPATGGGGAGEPATPAAGPKGRAARASGGRSKRRNRA